MWPIGYKFEYETNYGGGTIKGIVARLGQPSNYKPLTLDNYEELKKDPRKLAHYVIYSTKGAKYSLGEIELENLRDIRDRKLKDMGI